VKRPLGLAGVGLLAALQVGMLGGCTTVGFYAQAVQGHLGVLARSRAIEDVVADPATPADLKERLALVLRMREFASRELALPDNGSYRTYADLGRPAVVWNVFAAAEFSVDAKQWCFPIAGCVGYRGYFDEPGARAEAARLAATGLEVSVYGVPAYSTLGYSNWMGGDPLLSTFIGWPEGDFVRLLLHELAHQVAYAEGDTAFNESYATAVERLGVQRWLQQHATPATRAQFAASEERRAQWRALTQATRQRLAEIYASNGAVAPAHQALSAMKKEAMQDFRAAYATLRARWLAAHVPEAQLATLDRWVRDANNASFAAQAAYDEGVPAFMALFEREGRDWPRFHAAVRALAQAPQAERTAALQALAPQPPRVAHGGG
jgi:predicted aminopeptidase